MASNWPEEVSSLSIERQAALLATLSDDEAEALLHDWPAWRRPSQVEPPGDWRYWMILAGRGFGKTRMGAEWVRRRAGDGRFQYVNLIGATAEDPSGDEQMTGAFILRQDQLIEHEWHLAGSGAMRPGSFSS